MSEKKPSVKVEITPEEQQRYLETTALIGLEYVLTDFVKEFQASARRWERMVYPAMIIFGILGFSGFWLIYNLSQDMHAVSANIASLNKSVIDMDRNIKIMTATVEGMNRNVRQLNTTITDMNQSVSYIRKDMSAMSANLNAMPPMLANIAEMNQSVKGMTWNTGVMTRDMHNIGKPMRFFSHFWR